MICSIYFTEKPQRSIDEQWRSHEKHEKTKTRERLQPIGASAEHTQDDTNGNNFIKLFPPENLLRHSCHKRKLK